MNAIRRYKEQEGLALVVVLWVITIMTMLVASFSTIVKTNIVIAGAESDVTQHITHVDSGLDIAVFRMLDEVSKRKWLHPDKAQNVNFAGKALNIRIIDTSGLIDLNKADGKFLQDFLKRYANNSDQADTVLKAILGRRMAQAQKDTQQPKTQKKSLNMYSFSHVSELMTAKGMTLDFYNKIKAFMTVHNPQGSINPAVAPYEILLSVPGLSKPAIEGLLKRRSENPQDKKIYSDAITRSEGILSISDSNFFIIYITSTWKQSKKLVGRRYVVGIELDDTAPYRLMSWSEFSE